MKRITLNAEPRTAVGKHATKQLRRAGRVPVSLYGPEMAAPRALSVDWRELSKLLASHTASLVDLHITGEDDPVQTLLKDHDEHRVRGHVIHADFYQVSAGHKIHTVVPIEIVGNAPGVKAGGILERAVREVEIECLPRDLPEQIEVDVSQMEIGDSLHVSDLQLPGGVVIHGADESTTLVHCLMPRVMPTAEEEAAAAAAAEAEELAAAAAPEGGEEAPAEGGAED